MCVFVFFFFFLIQRLLHTLQGDEYTIGGISTIFTGDHRIGRSQVAGVTRTRDLSQQIRPGR